MENQTNTPAPATATPETSALPRARFTVPAGMLRAAFQACAPAMSKDPNRYVLNGLCLEYSPAPAGALPFLSVYGCDGRRLHAAQIPFPHVPGDVLPPERFTFVFPAAAVKSALKLCLPKKEKGEALLTFKKAPSGALVNPEQIPVCEIFTISGAVQSAETVAGTNYPNVRAVIPSLRKINAGTVRAPIANLRHALSILESASADAIGDGATWGADVAALCGAGAMQGREAGKAFIKSALRDHQERDNSVCFDKTPLTLPGACNVWQISPVPFSYSLTLPPAACYKFSASATPARAIQGPAINIESKRPPSDGNKWRVGFNQRFLAELMEACDVIHAAPGFLPLPPDGEISAPASENVSWDPLEIPCAAFDKGTSGAFVAVLMPQRLG